MNIVTHMTPAMQRLVKHVPEITLSTTEAPFKAGIVNSIVRQRLARTRLPWNYARFRHKAYMNSSSGTLGGGEFYPVLPKLQREDT
jgi:hypothetical protein